MNIEDKAVENLDAWRKRDRVAMNKWQVRDEMFRARMTALEAAMDRQNHLTNAVKGIAMGVALASVVLTHASTMGAWWRLAIAMSAWLVVRLAGRFAMHSWSVRTMARIERECPPPPPLEAKPW